LHAVMLAALSCQQPPLFSRHSFVCISKVIKKIHKSILHASYTWRSASIINAVKMEKLGKSMHQPSLKQTAGSIVSRKPAQSALRTAPLSSFPEKHRHQVSSSGNLNTFFIIIYRIEEHIPLYCLLLITRVGKMVTSPQESLPIYTTWWMVMYSD